MNCKYMQALFLVLAVSLFTVPQAAALSVNLTAPDTDYYSPSRNVTFTCNATDENLTNLTLFVWDSDNSTYFSSSADIMGTFNETNWTVNSTIPGDYTWNCMAYDNESNTDWADSNFSIHINLFNALWSSIEIDQTFDVAVADLDGDGDLDYISGNRDQPNRVYLNNGTGNFTLFESSDETDYTKAVSIADLDGDGDPDYVAGNRNQVNVVYLNNGTAHFTFHENVSETSGDETESVSLSDIDNDGDVDMVAVNIGTGLRIYKNNGSAHFTSFQNISGSFQDAAMGDLDGDGYADIVTGGIPAEVTRIFINNGSGYYMLNQSMTGSGSFFTYSLSLADIDNDADLDIIEGNGNTQNYRVYRNDGETTFTVTYVSGSIETRAVSVSDFNNDGRLDFIESNQGGADSIYINSGTGFSWFESTQSGTTYSVATADLDGDGDIDILTGNYGTANIVYLNSIDDENYVKVDVMGSTHAVNPSAIGTKVILSYMNGSIAGYREVTPADTTYGRSLQLHFGAAAGTPFILNASFITGKTVTCMFTPSENFSVYENGTSTGGVTCYVADFIPEIISWLPGNGNVTVNDTVNFTCRASDDNLLSQFRLYLWNSTELYYQSSVSTSGTDNLTNWYVQGMEPDNYIWTCMACDNNSQCNSVNSTFSMLLTNRLNVKLILNSTSSSIYIPGSGEYDSTSVSYHKSNPPHFFAVSTSGNVITGIVSAGSSPKLLAAGSESGDFYLTVEEKIEKSNIMLLFTEGDWRRVDTRIDAIETGKFLRSVSPSFSFGLGGFNTPQIVLEYAFNNLSGILRMIGKNTGKIVIENTGSTNSKTGILLSVNR